VREGMTERLGGSAAANLAQEMNNILRLGWPRPGPAPVEPEPVPASATSPAQGRDWSATIALVHQAAEAMRVIEERAHKAEARGKALAERAAEEMRTLEKRLEAAEAARRHAEARARAAEADAQEAEAWLTRLQEEIVTHLVHRRDRNRTNAA
jgi:hypothetical protein